MPQKIPHSGQMPLKSEKNYLRYRNSLDRFKAKGGVYKKLQAVEQVINTTRRRLGTGKGF